MQDFTLSDKICHDLRYRFRFDIRIDAVLIIKVDAVGSQTAKRFFHRMTDGSGACIGYQGVRACRFGCVKGQAEFRGNEIWSR